MTERPVLFSAPMVRAILDGRKTQTRRIVKFGEVIDHSSVGGVKRIALMPPKPNGQAIEWRPVSDAEWLTPIACPYGAPGDRLWVRETWDFRPWGTSDDSDRVKLSYGADGAQRDAHAPPGWNPMLYGTARWRPSIHMPRWASRVTLEVTSVRVERLQDMSRDDAIAEGARRFDDIPCNHPYPSSAARWSMEDPKSTAECLGCPEMAFANLWNRIYSGADWNLKDDESPWDANPWVWCVVFRRVRP